MRHLIDTAKIISEGFGNTNYHDYDLVITSYTFKEIQNKGLNIDSTRFSIIESPAFSDFKSCENSLYVWSDGTQTLQIVKYEQKSYIPALCGKHNTVFQISLIGGKSFNLCNEILEKDADFSQVTALLLDDDMKPVSTPDYCLGVSLNQVFSKKLIQ